MNTYVENINELNIAIENADDPIKYKNDLVQVLIKAKKSLTTEQFIEVEKISEAGFSENCGCSEDLDFLNSLFEKLSKHQIFDSAAHQRIIENSACNRWL